MPRDLADVLHHFLPELEVDGQSSPATEDARATAAALDPDEAPATPSEVAPSRRVEATPSEAAIGGARDRSDACTTRFPLPILGLPIGEHDVVRAALTWNLAIETARLGASAIVVAPDSSPNSPLWPEPGIGPLGSELVLVPARNLDDLYRAATDLARNRSRASKHGGIVFVRIPPPWLADGPMPTNPIRWLLLLAPSNRRDLDEAYELAKTLHSANPGVEVGVTIHGVEAVAEARSAFEYLSRISQEQLGIVLISYGLLVDDLHVYRAIAAQRPIGLAHPQAPATRALMDVARLLHEDARSRTLG